MIKHSADEKVLLWLNGIEGISLSRKREILTFDDNPYKFFKNLKSHKEKIIAVCKEEGYNKLEENYSSDALDECEKECNGGIDYITECSDNYPTLLRDIEKPPLALYFLGNLKALENIAIAIVGTRSMTSYGQRVAEFFAGSFAKVKIAVVSGLAYGIDKTAHEKTLEEGGCAIAVLGGGLKRMYPKENTDLARRIIKSGGLILTEYPPERSPKPYYFPDRNRIIAGLSNAVLIAEAGIKSGALITAQHAIMQDKKLFLVPGSIFSKNCDGVNAMIKDDMGITVTEPKDVFEAMGFNFISEEEKEDIEFDELEEFIIKFLESGEKHIEELLKETKLPINTLNSMLTKLEVCGIIKKLRGNYYGL